MPEVNHIFEPSRLFLAWHHLGEKSQRPRRIVGELYKSGSSISFRYLRDTEDYKLAEKEGFIGFPAFARSNAIYEDALDAFTKRIPPRKRADFDRYLSQYGLSANFNGSILSLLGYTGARLASDSFELCPDYSDITLPADLVIELAGANYHIAEKPLPAEGDTVEFFEEPDNEYDENAIAAYCQQTKIGYISRPLTHGFSELIKKTKIEGQILKSSRQQDKVQILVLVKCR